MCVLVEKRPRRGQSQARGDGAICIVVFLGLSADGFPFEFAEKAPGVTAMFRIISWALLPRDLDSYRRHGILSPSLTPNPSCPVCHGVIRKDSLWTGHRRRKVG